MKRDCGLVASFCADESGVTAIEYALIAALIAMAVAAVLATVGVSLKDLFAKVASCFPLGAC